MSMSLDGSVCQKAAVCQQQQEVMYESQATHCRGQGKNYTQRTENQVVHRGADEGLSG